MAASDCRQLLLLLPPAIKVHSELSVAESCWNESELEAFGCACAAQQQQGCLLLLIITGLIVCSSSSAASGLKCWCGSDVSVFRAEVVSEAIGVMLCAVHTAEACTWASLMTERLRMACNHPDHTPSLWEVVNMEFRCAARKGAVGVGGSALSTCWAGRLLAGTPNSRMFWLSACLFMDGGSLPVCIRAFDSLSRVRHAYTRPPGVKGEFDEICL